jgi:ankyrin repeat protein
VGSVEDGDSSLRGGEGDAFVSVSVASEVIPGHEFSNTVTLMLIRCGADVNKCHFDGRSPLFVTCSRGRAELAEILLEAGADPLAMPLWLGRPSDEPRMDGCPRVRDKIRKREQELLNLRDAAELADMEDATRSMVLM